MSQEKQTCSQAIKAAGVKSTVVCSEKSGVPESTLKVWFRTKRFLFDAVVEKVARDGQNGKEA